MINATQNSGAHEAIEAALVARIKSFGEPADLYNVAYLAQNFASAAEAAALERSDFLRLVYPPRPEDLTETPCPSWCRYEHGHLFESETHEGLQCRYHSIDVPSPRGTDVSIVQEETREKGDDNTFARGQATIWINVDLDSVDATKAREIAAAMAWAANKLEEITSGGEL